MKGREGNQLATGLTYFSLLGVGEDASQEELEARYRELAEYLDSPAVPAQLQEWARRQVALVDEAYAVLTDPERRAAVRRERRPATEAEAQPHLGTKKAGGGRHQLRAAEEPDAEVQEEPPEKVRRRAGAGGSSRWTAGQPDGRGVGVLDGLLGLRSRPIFLGILIGLLVLSAIMLGRYGLPGSGAGEVTTAGEQEDTPDLLDRERVAELMTAVQQNPGDPEVLFELGEAFFQANEWQSAIDWFTRLLAVDPNNIHALTDIGTANFNLGRPEEAEAAWLTVLELDAGDVQVHYNLGFLYANVEPRDLALARQEWQTVVDLAPDSDLARTVQVHLDSLLEETETEASPP